MGPHCNSSNLWTPPLCVPFSRDPYLLHRGDQNTWHPCCPDLSMRFHLSLQSLAKKGKIIPWYWKSIKSIKSVSIQLSHPVWMVKPYVFHVGLLQKANAPSAFFLPPGEEFEFEAEEAEETEETEACLTLLSSEKSLTCSKFLGR